MSELEDLAARIHRLCPDLEIRHAELDVEGLMSDVVIVNGDVVCRFAKSDEQSRRADSEVKLLEFLQDRLPAPIPAPFVVAPGAMAYRLIRGQVLTAAGLDHMSTREQIEIARHVGRFLHALHDVPVETWMPEAQSLCDRPTCLRLRKRVEEHVYPLLARHQRAWAESLFGDFLTDPATLEYEPALIHGDLGCYHLLFDSPPARLTGVIDFGTSGTGDPAIDLAPLLQAWGEPFVRRFEDGYPGVTRHLDRARFYAQLIELMWIATGLRRGDPRWFAAHLGGARAFGLGAANMLAGSDG